ncbi:MAG TPA: O-antigen ligase family protein [Thermomicrobiales bacterium]|nr:O-antigen ligase family protein [Thermomicrobiales bacterium]
MARWIGYGMALLPVVGATVPFVLGTGTSSGIVAALMLAIALLGLWVLRLIATRNLVIAQSPINLPVVTVILVWLLATVSSNVFLDPRIAVRLGTAFTIVQVAALMVTMVSLGLLLLGANVGIDRRFVRLSTWAILAVGALAISAYFAGFEPQLSALNTNGLFTLWVVALSYGQALFNQRLSYPARFGLLSIAGAFLVKTAIFQTGWLSGWAPAVTAVGLLTLFRSRSLFFGGVVLAAIVGLGFEGRIYDAVFQSQLDEGSDSRLDIWAQAWDLLSQYPLLGTGPAGYAAYYMTLYAGSGSSLSTHSNYIDVAAQTGIAGSVAFIWLLVMVGVTAWRACQRWKDGFEGGFVHATAAGFVGVIVAMALGDWLIPFVYNQGIEGFRYTVHSWVFLGFMAGLANARPEQTER